MARKHRPRYNPLRSRSTSRPRALGAAILKAGPEGPVLPRSREGESQQIHVQPSRLGGEPGGGRGLGSVIERKAPLSSAAFPCGSLGSREKTGKSREQRTLSWDPGEGTLQGQRGAVWGGGCSAGRGRRRAELVSGGEVSLFNLLFLSYFISWFYLCKFRPNYHKTHSTSGDYERRRKTLQK